MTTRIAHAAVCLTVAVAASAASLDTVQAQGSPAATTPAFEAASVKPNKSGDQGFCICGPRSDRFVNVPLDVIVTWAFGVRADQVLNVPSWARTERFDIVAKLPEGSAGGIKLVMQMTQSLLVERFNLKVHTETRDGPAYALVMARRDRRLGPRLKPNAVDCAAYLAEKRAAGQMISANGIGDAPLCAPAVVSDRFVKASAKPIDLLTNAIARQVGRPVIDKTGLAGNFDYNLEWSPQLSAPPAANQDGRGVAADGVPLVTALEEQLGLKLEPIRAPEQVIVVEQLERPTPD
jgi:uncharacterized protein (TIGR03435 family)